MKNSDNYDVLIVGAGLTGATYAWILSNAGFRVKIVDKRDHVAGNAHTFFDKKSGAHIHAYGAHIFHTSNSSVWNFVRRFSNFNDYRHTVFSRHPNIGMVQLPFNLMTINQVFGMTLNPQEAREFIEGERVDIPNPKNLEEKALSLVGRRIYSVLIKDYTVKQWGVHPRKLPPEVITRLPFRFNYDSNYFNDKYQGIPTDGYTFLVERMLERCDVELGRDFNQIMKFRSCAGMKHAVEFTDRPYIIYTGAIDEFFDYKFSRLNWRSVDFVFETLEMNDFQGTSVVNEPSMVADYTRTIEFKHFTPERPDTGFTTIAREYSKETGPNDVPYYPTNLEEDRSVYAQYKEEASKLNGIDFAGRLGTYKYLDMHMAIGIALQDMDIVNRVRDWQKFRKPS